jgi:hypothetical protein
MLGILLLCGVHAGGAMAQGASAAVLLRVFLDRRHAPRQLWRVGALGDRVVFSMPLDPLASSPTCIW